MKDLDASSLQNVDGRYLILFWAPWAEPSLLVEQLLDDQSSEYPSINLGKLNVDEQSEIVQLFQVQSVPTTIILDHGKVIKKYSGSDPMKILELLQDAQSDPSSKEDVPLEDRLKMLINKHPFMIFIKGTPNAPRCGFTSQLLAKLRELQVQYDYFDILADPEIRQGLKELSNWPTYPQIYVDGELLGGLDIFMDMLSSGELQPILDSLKA